jgi:hypothetical protein
MDVKKVKYVLEVKKLGTWEAVDLFGDSSGPCA